MVSATNRPDALLVSFTEHESPFQRTEIVCIVEATDNGPLDIRYQHHTTQHRPTGQGEWETETKVRMHVLTPVALAVIRTNVMYELFSAFEGKIKTEGPTGQVTVG